MSAAASCFVNLDDLVLLRILDKLSGECDRKAWTLTCKQFYNLEAACRKTVRLSKRELLRKVFNKHPNLEHLDLSMCSKITDEELRSISGARLRSLSVFKLKGFSYSGINSLARRCRSLEAVDFSGCVNSIGDSSIAAISQLPSLKSLKLTGCLTVSDQGLRSLSSGCRRLRLLVLKGCSRISDAGIQFISASCKELTALDVSFTQITDQALKMLSRVESLRELNLSGCLNVGDEGLMHTNASLLSLDLSRCKKVTAAGLSALGEKCSLRHLNLSYSPFPISRLHVQALGKLRNLETLKLNATEIIAFELRFLGYDCKQLRELSLSKCTGITDDDLKCLLSNSPRLSILDLTCCRELTQASIISVSKLHCLRSLKLEACKTLATDANVGLLAKNCHLLEDLDLTECNISSEGLRFLTWRGTLRSLKLEICNLSDEGLSYIGRGCKNLEELDIQALTGGLVGDSGVAAISQRLSSSAVSQTLLLFKRVVCFTHLGLSPQASPATRAPRLQKA